MADCRNEFLVQINGWRGDFCGTLLTPINRPGTRGSLARSGWEWEILTSTFPIVMDHAARVALSSTDSEHFFQASAPE